MFSLNIFISTVISVATKRRDCTAVVSDFRLVRFHLWAQEGSLQYNLMIIHCYRSLRFKVPMAAWTWVNITSIYFQSIKLTSKQIFLAYRSAIKLLPPFVALKWQKEGAKRERVGYICCICYTKNILKVLAGCSHGEHGARADCCLSNAFAGFVDALAACGYKCLAVLNHQSRR